MVSTYMLSIRPEFKVRYIDLPLVLVAYIIGKVLLAFIWIAVMSLILTVSLTKAKYYTKMNELEEYLILKAVPKALESKLRNFYRYKLRGVGLDENAVQQMLSNNLKREIRLRVTTEALTKKVYLFKYLSKENMVDISLRLSFQIYLPQSIIIQYGDNADSMYFISNGTVAVYTHSGREVCHLSDGSYFGEICLIKKQQKQTCTIIAIEFCEVFKLHRRYFEKILMTNKKIRKYLKKAALKRRNLSRHAHLSSTLFQDETTLSLGH